MRSRLSTCVCLLVSLATAGLAVPGPARALEPETYRQIARQALDGHIRPRYDRLNQAVAALAAPMEQLCETPAAAALKDAQTALRTAIAAWAGVEHIRFGPVAEDNRYERLARWPDRKSIGLRQVRRILRDRDPSALDPVRLAKKSVAVQGLVALEYVLFGAGHEDLATTGAEARFRCRYGLAAARNVQAIAETLVAEWAKGGAFAKAYLQPSPEAPVYRTHQEVVLDLFKAYTGGLKQLEKLKLGLPLGGEKARPRPKRAAFWRSGSALTVISENIAAARDLYVTSGFAGVIDRADEGVGTSYLHEYGLALKAVRDLEPPIAEVLGNEETRARLRYVRVVVRALLANSGNALVQAAGLPLAFNAFDGD